LDLETIQNKIKRYLVATEWVYPQYL